MRAQLFHFRLSLEKEGIQSNSLLTFLAGNFSDMYIFIYFLDHRYCFPLNFLKDMSKEPLLKSLTMVLEINVK